MSKQLLRSGTSIGANLAEAVYASSRRDFTAKLYIALKECAETAYWLELLYECDYYLPQSTPLSAQIARNCAKCCPRPRKL